MADENAVRNAVAAVVNESDKYHMGSAVFAVEALLTVQRGRLYKELFSAYAEAARNRLLKEKSVLQRQIKEYNESGGERWRIFVDYSAIAKRGRTTLHTSAYTVILPRLPLDKLLDGLPNSYDFDAANSTRKTLAHELGHLMLHLKDNQFNGNRSTEGTGQFDDDTEKEAEANVFADLLLEERAKRRALKETAFNAQPDKQY